MLRDGHPPDIAPDHVLTFTVPETKVVAALYPEAPEFAAMPRVFATGFLVGLVEWACMRALRPFLDWPREQTVGTKVDITHEAPTPPGVTLTVRVWLTLVAGRRSRFWVEVRDGQEVVGRGRHERVVVDAARFEWQAHARAAR